MSPQLGDRLANTINARNAEAGGGAPDCGHVVGRALESGGHNLIGDVTACTLTGDLAGNITGRDPGLAALADYGGPTRTHRPLAGSVLHRADRPRQLGNAATRVVCGGGRP